MKKILYGIIFLVSISFLPIFAQTNPITVQTDDKNYDEGDTIVISGEVTTVVPGTPVVLQVFFEANLIEIAQITIAQDGSYSHTVITEGPLWNKAGNYLIRVSFGEGNVAETEFEFSPKTNVPDVTSIFEVDAGSSGTFDIEYTIKGGIVMDMTIDPKFFALIVQVDARDEGSITLDLPREFIGAEKQDGKDDVFIILIDNIEVPYSETITNSDSRKITIDFEQGDKDIGIIGTYVIPEFATIVMMILIVGITGSILITKNRIQARI
jgi:predicted secreted protein with PEFG-CTERM motif